MENIIISYKDKDLLQSQSIQDLKQKKYNLSERILKLNNKVQILCAKKS